MIFYFDLSQNNSGHNDSVLIDLLPVPDLYDKHNVPGFDPIDDTIIPHTKAASAFKTVTKRFSEFDRMGSQFFFDRFPYLLFC